VSDDRYTLHVPFGKAEERTVELFMVSERNSSLRQVERDFVSTSGWIVRDMKVEGLPERAIRRVQGLAQGTSLFALLHVDPATPAKGDSDGQPVAQVEPAYRDDNGNWKRLALQKSQAAWFRMAQARGMFSSDLIKGGDDALYFYTLHYKGHEQEDTAFQLFRVVDGSMEMAYVEGTVYGPRRYRMVPGNRNHPLILVKAQEAGTLTMVPLKPKPDQPIFFVAETPRQIRHGHGMLAPEQVFPIPAADGRIDFILHTRDQRLFLISDAAGAAPTLTFLGGTAIGPATVLRAGLSRTADGGAVLAIVDATRQLWVRRHSASGPGSGILDREWHPLETGIINLSCPSDTDATAELFVVTEDRHLVRYVQDEVDGSWHRTLIAEPVASDRPAEKVVTHNVEVRTVTVAGAPATNAQVEVSASRPVAVTIDGMTRHIGPGQPALCRSNATGRLRVALRADTMGAPEIRVRVPEFMKEPTDFQSLRPDGAVVRRMAGTETGYPVTVDALKAGGLLPAGLDPRQADAMAGLIKDVGKAITAPPANALGAEANHGVRYTLDFSPDDGLTIDKTAITHREEAPFATDGLWDWLSNGDAARWLTSRIADIGKAVIDVAGKVVTFVFEVGEELKKFTLKVVDAAKQAAIVLQGLEIALKKLAGAALDVAGKLFDFFKSVFGWDDIVTTKKVLKGLVNTALDTVSDTLSDALPKAVSNTLAEIKQALVANLDDLSGVLDDKPVGGVGQAGSGDPQLRRASKELGVQCNFVADNVAALRFDPFQGAKPGAALEADGLFAEFKTKVEQSARDSKLHTVFRQFGKALDALDSPAALLKFGVMQLLRIVREVVIVACDLTDALITLMLKLLGKVIAGVKELLNLPIDIPVISPLYRSLTGESLSVIDAACLLIAVPGTILFKVVHGGEAPFPLGKPLSVPVRGALSWTLPIW
jgi:hypothetical protein